MLEEIYKLLYEILRRELGEAAIQRQPDGIGVQYQGRNYHIVVWSLDTMRPSTLHRLGDLPDDLSSRIRDAIISHIKLQWQWLGGHLQCLTPTVPFEVGYRDVS